MEPFHVGIVIKRPDFTNEICMGLTPGHVRISEPAATTGLNGRWTGNVMWKKVLLLLLVLVIAMVGRIWWDLQTERNDVSIALTDPVVPRFQLKVAVVGDVHLQDTPTAFDAFRLILDEIRQADPDLVLFVGDYTENPGRVENVARHRAKIIQTLKTVDWAPKAIVLGNYESWSNAPEWLREFRRMGVRAMENEVDVIDTAMGAVCVRGFGDKYTGRFRYVDFPAKCRDLPRLSIMHDPAGAFDPRLRGLAIAGHTHCGQVQAPFMGPVWVPSSVPPAARCGLYRDQQRTLFVTSGLGTSLLPIRFFAPSQWDLLDLTWN